jgi:ubiquinone/menaquinone biosynthesis C-methylase UbiE
MSCAAMNTLRSPTRTRGSRLAIVVALVVGLLGADCDTRLRAAAYEGDDRDSWQQTERVVETLGLRPGQRVADLGSGSGYFTGPLARAVAPGGSVLAVDVDAEMNAYLEARMAEQGIGNVTTVLATPDDPGLPDGAIDLLFTSNTFHHLPEPSSYFASLRGALAPGGRVAIVEYEPAKAGWFARTFGHATSAAEIAAALEAAGYRRVADHDFLERQSFQIFAPTTDED